MRKVHILTLLLVLSFAVSAHAVTIVSDCDGTVKEGDDTYMRGGAGYTTGTMTDASAATDYKCMVKFDLSSVTFAVTAATLKIHNAGTLSYDKTYYAYRSLEVGGTQENWVAAQSSWSYADKENDEMWTTAGGYYDSTLAGSATAGSSEGWLSMDVSSAVEDAILDGQVYITFWLLGSSADRQGVYQSEDLSGRGPVLEIIPEPATMGLLAIGGLAALIRRKR